MDSFPDTPPDVGEIIELWTKDPKSREHITAVKVIPEREAQYDAYPSVVHPLISQALKERGMPEPYTHQAEAIRLAMNGKNVVIVTPTASGKTLCYNVPVINEIISGGEGRALYLFPTKALAQDQLAELADWADVIGKGLNAFTYDGDTPREKRSGLRKSARILITNPDMLHLGILPHHTRWATFFTNLKYVVIDEMHVYRGIFGSHFTNLMRRLKRVCRFYGGSPQFICASATIANPDELAEKLTEEEIVLVEKNGAPASEKYLIFYNPPLVNEELGLRANYLRVARSVASYFLQRKVQTIVFATSRMNVEILVKYLSEEFAGLEDTAEFIAGYRGGYLPDARRRIEQGLREGRITGVVATNALELGIDIGRLDACVIAGYPGSVASTWQQAGRAGRRSGRSAAVLVARSNPLDQFIVQFPEYFLGRSPEHGLVNPDNLHVLVDHIKCAAFELPLSAEEKFGGEDLSAILEFLEEQGLLHRSGKSYHYTSEKYPAQEISLRTASAENFLVVDVSEAEKVIAEVDFETAHRTVFENAVYMAEGERYVVEKLDWNERKAYVHPAQVDYFTVPLGFSDVKVISGFELAMFGASSVEHGEVEIKSMTTGFKKVRFYTGEILGEGEVDLPERVMLTTAYWFSIPEEVIDNLGFTRAEAIDGVLGMAHLLRHVAAFTLMCDVSDLGSSVGDRSREWVVRSRPGETDRIIARSNGSDEPIKVDLDSIEVFEPAVYIYENYPGGVGFSPVLFREHSSLIERAAAMVEKCGCPDGCPSCVGPVAEVGIRGKDVASAVLRNLLTS